MGKKPASHLTHFSEKVIVNSSADADDDSLSLQKLLDPADDLRAPRPAAVLSKRATFSNVATLQLSSAAVPAGYSPGRHSASCLRGEGCEHPSV